MMSESKPDLHQIDFSQSPYLVIWETTQACALKCLHCRAEAVDRRDPRELTTEQSLALLEEIRRFGKVLVVLTGGDPMRRPDLAELIRYGNSIGLRMALTPSATAEVTKAKILDLKANGLARLAISLDGSTPEIHDHFRGVPGSYEWTRRIVEWAREAGIPVQINTTVTRYNYEDLDRLCALMETLEIVLWSVFFLVPVGRGQLQDEIRGRDFEKVFHKLAVLRDRASFDIKTTEAPHFRRVLIQKSYREGRPTMHGSFVWAPLAGKDTVGRSSKGVNDGNGFAFVSHTGDIFPSGFLPLRAGNVKADSLVQVYRESEIFKSLRDPKSFKGKCGVCDYNEVCGGSRARAYALTADPLASDPFCVYMPKGYQTTETESTYW